MSICLHYSTNNETAKDIDKQKEADEKSKGDKGRLRKDNVGDGNKNKDESEKGEAKDIKEGENCETVCLTKEEEEEIARVRKEEKKRRDREYLETLRRASAASNIQPLGRDRLFRRYWAFHSLKGLFVEDDDPDLPLFLGSEEDVEVMPMKINGGVLDFYIRT